MTDASDRENDDFLPVWASLVSDYLDPGVPGFIVIRGHPRVALFIDAGGLRFGAQVELTGDAALPASPLA